MTKYCELCQTYSVNKEKISLEDQEYVAKTKSSHDNHLSLYFCLYPRPGAEAKIERRVFLVMAPDQLGIVHPGYKIQVARSVNSIIGAVLPTSTLFIGALIFLMILAVQFSVRISSLTNQVKNLVQENALLRDKIAEIKAEQNL